MAAYGSEALSLGDGGRPELVFGLREISSQCNDSFNTIIIPYPIESHQTPDARILPPSRSTISTAKMVRPAIQTSDDGADTSYSVYRSQVHQIPRTSSGPRSRAARES